MAMASENTSRPQFPDTDSGVRNCPTDERRPKLNKAITQPHPTTKAGVRQPARGAAKVMDIKVSPQQDGECRSSTKCRKHRRSGGVPQTKVADPIDFRRAWPSE